MKALKRWVWERCDPCTRDRQRSAVTSHRCSPRFRGRWSQACGCRGGLPASPSYGRQTGRDDADRAAELAELACLALTDAFDLPDWLSLKRGTIGGAYNQLNKKVSYQLRHNHRPCVVRVFLFCPTGNWRLSYGELRISGIDCHEAPENQKIPVSSPRNREIYAG